MGGEGTLIVMIGSGISAMNFSNSGAFFIAISFISSGSQKKENSETCFRNGDVETFVGEVISFVSSASEFQKKRGWRWVSYEESLAMRRVLQERDSKGHDLLNGGLWELEPRSL